MMPSRLSQLLAPNGLQAVFQPVVELDHRSARVHYVEGLVRGPAGSTMERADVLFDYARLCRAQVAIDRACCAVVLAAARHLPADAIVGLNVHAATLARDPEFLCLLSDQLEATGRAADRLVIEIVEHASANDAAQIREPLDALRSIGVRVALDDFGMGQANYAMLLDVAPQYVKLDRVVIKDCHRDFRRLAVVESALVLAGRVGARVVAEGIDNVEDLLAVRDAGVDLVQGYLLAKPCAPSDVAATHCGLAAADLAAGGREVAPTRRARGAMREKTMQRKKVLIVDDSKTSLFMERMILTQAAAFDIATANDGQEALEQARRERPDVILMDVVMPRMDGIEALRTLRDQDVTRDIPVIMVTTKGEGPDLEVAFSAGCSDYVTKPIDAVELLTKVRSLVQ